MEGRAAQRETLLGTCDTPGSIPSTNPNDRKETKWPLLIPGHGVMLFSLILYKFLTVFKI